MLVNITSEHYHPVLLEKAKEAFPDDPSMAKYLNKIKGTNFIPSKYKGIMYCGSLNPHVDIPPSIDLETYLSTITLSKPIDKRNRKFRKALGFRQTEFHIKPWDEAKDLSQEEIRKLHNTYTDNYYFKGNGVCDNEDQVYRMYKWLEDQDGEYCIFLTPMFKEHQPPRGGWRWEKWGEYIGHKESKADYLYDEPDIDMILIFSICKVVRKELVYTSPEGIKLYKERFGWDMVDSEGRSLGVVQKDKEAPNWYKVGYHGNPFFYTNDDEFDNISKVLSNYLKDNL